MNESWWVPPCGAARDVRARHEVLVLKTRSGDVARVAALLRGLPEFPRLVLTHAPADAIDRETLAVLEATAAGNPPPVWG